MSEELKEELVMLLSHHLGKHPDLFWTGKYRPLLNELYAHIELEKELAYKKGHRRGLFDALLAPVKKGKK